MIKTLARASTARQEANPGFHYKASGLSDVWLVNGFTVETTTDGPAVRIEDVDGLHAAIARSVVATGRRLAAAEVRFLRKLLALSQADLAGLLGVSDQTVARWEKAATAIDPAADRLLRFLVREHLGDSVAIRKGLNALAQSGGNAAPERRLQHRRTGWRLAA